MAGQGRYTMGPTSLPRRRSWGTRRGRGPTNSWGDTMWRMIAAFSITPLGTGESVGDFVAEAVHVVRASGLPHETNAMFTDVEGEWDEVMAVIRECVDRLSNPPRAFRL